MGSIAAHGLLRDAVIVSDDAGQFDVGTHALYWVHAERLLHRLDTFTDEQRAAQQQLRAVIRRIYADLKAYREVPSRRRSQLRAFRAHLPTANRLRQRARPARPRQAARSSLNALGLALVTGSASQGDWERADAYRLASIASQIAFSRSTPSKRAISCRPVGEVTLISVR